MTYLEKYGFVCNILLNAVSDEQDCTLSVDDRQHALTVKITVVSKEHDHPRLPIGLTRKFGAIYELMSKSPDIYACINDDGKVALNIEYTFVI